MHSHCGCHVIPKINYRQKDEDFVNELKANQRSLQYELEDKIKTVTAAEVHAQAPCLEHDRIQTRTCRIFRRKEFIADEEKWNGILTVIEILTDRKRNLMTGKHLNRDCTLQVSTVTQSSFV